MLLNDAIARGKRVLFEGAQGTMLDIDHGTYPFVTSSSAAAGGACTGTGVPPTRIGGIIGVSKAYITRVGSGPFPTESTDAAGDLLRREGNEFGAVTGRPRRCGWFDAPLLRYTAMVNGFDTLHDHQARRARSSGRNSGVRRLSSAREDRDAKCPPPIARSK